MKTLIVKIRLVRRLITELTALAIAMAGLLWVLSDL